MKRIGEKLFTKPLRSRRTYAGSVSSQSGFTITELFVVIVIMTVLSAILLPALNKGRIRSQAISCLNNLRQLQLGWQMYSDDNNSAFVENNYVNGFKFLNVISSFGDSWCPGNTQLDTTPENIQRGGLYSYNRSTSIYRCPADNSKVQSMSTSQQPLRTRSYSMSASIGCNQTALPSYLKFSETMTPSPSRLFVFIDVNEAAITDAHFALPRNVSEKKWIDMPADRHDMAGNLSFADGHIERWTWASAKEFRNYQQEANGKELSDLKRLRDAMHP